VDRSPPRRSFRSRSRDRRSGGYQGSSRQRRSSGAGGGGSRRDRSPEKRAEHEIYIGNYPVKFREADVRKLFEENAIKVGAIRMKHDGLKVFAFAETESSEMVEKAKTEMEGVEIQGRKLRVRSSKDTDKKRREEKRAGSNNRDDWRSEKKRRMEREPLKREEVTRHLIAAFVAFIDRELGRDGNEQSEEFKGLMEAAKTALSTAYSLPEDDSLRVPRNIEDIFFRDVRNDIKVDRPEIKEIKEEKDEGDGADDDGNWKRRGRGKDEDMGDDEDEAQGENDDNDDVIDFDKDGREYEENLNTSGKMDEAVDEEEEDEEEIDDGNNDLENAIAKEEEEIESEIGDDLK